MSILMITPHVSVFFVAQMITQAGKICRFDITGAFLRALRTCRCLIGAWIFRRVSD
ncbi:hypothetical protein PLUA15_290021 [Pseudomonas lundensis]|jgi:hypothetical protein|uniref:Uncharacterized protein n=1 Tax=Pseudomonas lundensis TaxID=86185 RepID=A0AAX2HA78_9PSED|nr:hypothetical protein PLUA15_290021 [Pseudomonas lundensis]